MTLTLLALALAALVLYAALAQPRPAHVPWRPCDASTRRLSTVDHVRACGYTAPELVACAAEAPAREAELLRDLARAREVEERLDAERARYARDLRRVRTRVQVRGVA